VFQQINLAPPDEPDWTKNYRVPDILLLTPDRFAINHDTHFAGAPLVVEIRSPDDETFEKFGFYAGLGVPEVWVFDRDTRTPQLFALGPGGYAALAAGPDGWTRSPAAGVEFRPAAGNRVRARVGGDDATAEDLPDV
jgi:Uma2 family endonuclease